MNRAQLIPEYIRRRLPTIDEIAFMQIDELTAQVKYFVPDSDWIWYGLAFDGDDTFYGVVDAGETEYGYFWLDDLLELRGRRGRAVERDNDFAPQPVKPIFDQAAKRRNGSYREEGKSDGTYPSLHYY